MISKVSRHSSQQLKKREGRHRPLSDAELAFASDDRSEGREWTATEAVSLTTKPAAHPSHARASYHSDCSARLSPT